MLAVQGSRLQALDAAAVLSERASALFPAVTPVVLVAEMREGAPVLVPPGEAGPDGPARALQDVVPSASQGAVPGRSSPLGALLREGVAREAVGMAIVAAESHDPSVEWVERLLAPVVEEGFDFVCPAYTRRKTEGAINTGIVAPLLRALYGVALRQPLGTEAALSLGLARRLLADEDWRRRPGEAGSDAWLLAKVLSGDARVAQAWLGLWPRPAVDPEQPSQTLSRALDMVFVEMERNPDRWQRVAGSRPVPTFGTGSFDPAPPGIEAARLVEAFSIGLRDLQPIWSLVLPPATLLDLHRLAAAPASAFEIPDPLWARIVYDFAVAHLTRAVERGQLLRSLTPLYMGWLAGLVRSAASLDDASFEARLEAVADGFEREKRYLIRRWRWPDDFNP